MPKHTPEPWVAISATAEGGDQSDEYFIKTQPHPAMRGFTKDIAMVEGEADAKLIAAAPQMFATLQRLLSDHDGETAPRPDGEIVADICAAIARAEGK